MEIVRLRHDELAEASRVLAHAFQDDPAWAWVVPNARKREQLLPWLFRVAFEATEGEAWGTAGPLVGCSRGLGPGRPVVRVGPIVRALLATPFKARESTGRFLAYGRAVEAMRAEAVPEPGTMVVK